MSSRSPRRRASCRTTDAAAASSAAASAWSGRGTGTPATARCAASARDAGQGARINAMMGRRIVITNTNRQARKLAGGAPLAPLYALMYGLGNGMLTIVKGTAIAQYVSREHVASLNGALGLPQAAVVAGAVGPAYH